MDSFFEDLKILNLAVVRAFCYQQKTLVKTFQEVWSGIGLFWSGIGLFKVCWHDRNALAKSLLEWVRSRETSHSRGARQIALKKISVLFLVICHALSVPIKLL